MLVIVYSHNAIVTLEYEYYLDFTYSFSLFLLATKEQLSVQDPSLSSQGCVNSSLGFYWSGFQSP